MNLVIIYLIYITNCEIDCIAIDVAQRLANQQWKVPRWRPTNAGMQTTRTQNRIDKNSLRMT